MLLTLMCSLRSHTAGLILLCKVPYPLGTPQRSGVVVVVAGMPRTAGRIVRQGRNSTAGWGLPNKVFSATRVCLRGYRTSVFPLATDPIASNSVNIVHHLTTEPRVSAQHCSESDGRLHMHCPFSERVYQERLCTCVPFSSDQYLAVLCSLRLRIPAVYHMVLSSYRRRR